MNEQICECVSSRAGPRWRSARAWRRIGFSRMAGAALILPLLVTASAWDRHSPVLAGLMATLGIVMAVLGTLGRVWCAAYISGHKSARIVTEGPYSASRHPLYFFSLIGSLGVALTTETIVVPLIVGVAFALIYRATMADEERWLTAAFGPEYERYASRVPRFWPRWSLLREPERVWLCPRAFRRALADAGWFVIAAWLFSSLEVLRDVGVLPTWLYVY